MFGICVVTKLMGHEQLLIESADVSASQKDELNKHLVLNEIHVRLTIFWKKPDEKTRDEICILLCVHNCIKSEAVFTQP